MKPDITPRMTALFKTTLTALGAFCVLIAPTALRAQSGSELQDVQFRGCDTAGWCRFWVDSPDPARSLLRVRPDNVLRMSGDDVFSIAVRNRLNALLSDMIHQAKHIDLNDLRKLDDGTYAATVTVTGIALASDPVLVGLREKAAETNR
ncbi:MAG: hypothetical protein ABI771_10860 [Betaproteobacteria bacterium]